MDVIKRVFALCVQILNYKMTVGSYNISVMQFIIFTMGAVLLLRLFYGAMK